METYSENVAKEQLLVKEQLLAKEQLLDKEQLLVKEQLREKGYELCFPVGEGATSRVFCVREKAAGKISACKTSRRIEWLEAESELMQKIQHPVFPAWERFWTEDGRAFLIMEYLPGTGFKDFLADRGCLPCGEMIRIALALAEGLAYLHGQNPPVIFKDLKPDNIIIGDAGKIRLLDLGAASVKSGWRVGTPGYSAPELLKEKDSAVCASDIFSLGVLMFEMLTGRNPALGGEVSRSVRTYRKDVPAGIDQMIGQCLRADLKERIPDAQMVISVLSGYRWAGFLRRTLLEMRAFYQRKRYKQVVFEKNIYKKRI